MTKRLIRHPRRNVLSIRNMLVLFLTTLTISLIILSVLFNVVFKNIDMSFNTHIPDMAPIPEDSIETQQIEKDAQTESTEDKEPEQARFIQEHVYSASLNVPGALTYQPKPKPISAPTPTMPQLNTIEGIPIPTPLPGLSSTPPAPQHLSPQGSANPLPL